MSLTLYIDSDGTPRSTHVLVLDKDGSCLGELRNVQHLDWSLAVDGLADLKLRVVRVPGRVLAESDRAVLEVVRPTGGVPWWWVALFLLALVALAAIQVVVALSGDGWL